MKRADDFEKRREHLANLSNDELKAKFWKLTQEIVDPLLKLGYENTSPAIERSVLLRMGFSSLEVAPIVAGAMERNLLGHGAGNIVYKLANSRNIPIRQAGLELAAGNLWNEAAVLFGDEEIKC